MKTFILYYVGYTESGTNSQLHCPENRAYVYAGRSDDANFVFTRVFGNGAVMYLNESDANAVRDYFNEKRKTNPYFPYDHSIGNWELKAFFTSHIEVEAESLEWLVHRCGFNIKQ